MAYLVGGEEVEPSLPMDSSMKQIEIRQWEQQMGRREKKARSYCLSQDYLCHLRISILGIKSQMGISMGLLWAAHEENQMHFQSPVCRDSGSCREGSRKAWHSKGSVQPPLPKHSVINSKKHRKMLLLMLVWYLR